MKKTMTKLHLGCGALKLTGYINVDASPACNPDVVFDLNKRWPWKDDSISQIFSDNFLEHADDLFHVMSEASRVLCEFGDFRGYVPYAKTHGAFMDPTHKHFFTEQTFSYWCGRTHFTPNLFIQRRCQLVCRPVTFGGRVRNLLPFKPVLNKFLWNIYDNVYFHLIKR